MNIRTLSKLVVIPLLSAATSVVALPRGYSNNGMDYVEGDHDLSRWTCGGYIDGQARDVDVSGMSVRMKAQLLMGYVGYDPFRWCTVYATAGSGNTDIGDTSKNCPKYGIGARFNFLDHEILDPTLSEDRIRINGSVQYAMAQAKSLDKNINYSDLGASLTMAIINDLDGNVMFLPNSIGFFAGVAYSDLRSSSIKVHQPVGFTAGLEFFVTERVTIDLSMVQFSEAAYMGGIHLRL